MHVLLTVITTGISPFYVGWRERKDEPFRLGVRIGARKTEPIIPCGFRLPRHVVLRLYRGAGTLRIPVAPRSRRKLEGKEPYERRAAERPATGGGSGGTRIRSAGGICLPGQHPGPGYLGQGRGGLRGFLGELGQGA